MSPSTIHEFPAAPCVTYTRPVATLSLTAAERPDVGGEHAYRQRDGEESRCRDSGEVSDHLPSSVRYAR